MPPATRPPLLIYAPVSAGELLDKISILDIKLRRIADRDKHDHIQDEYAALRVIERGSIETDAETQRLARELADVNERLWDIEEAIRAHEARHDFGEAFVALARSVYTFNDQRAALKKAINTHTGSTLTEEKSYGPDAVA